MKNLSATQFEKAKQFLCTEARALEHALFLYEFENGNEQDVLIELEKYQNEDGGFGNGLEPDLRCTTSSALATTVALQHLAQLHSVHKDELAAGCFRFFSNTYKPEQNGWDIIPKEADQHPRAIWWNYSEQTEHWGNPNAEIVAYLLQYPHLVSAELHEIKTSLLQYAVTYIQQQCERNEMHELFCFLKLFDALPEPLKHQIEQPMMQFVEQSVVNRPEDRNGYCAVPLQVALTPQSIYYSQFSDIIPNDLDQLIDSQSNQGVWEPNWTWGRYEEQWETAKREWTGIITLNNLRILRAYHRLEV